MDAQEKTDFPREIAAAFAAAAILMAAGLYLASRLQKTYLDRRVQAQIAAWPVAPRMVAETMIEKYGPPDYFAAGELVWLGRPPWKRILVHEDRRGGPLEEVVGYDATMGKAEALRAFGRGVTADPVNSELSARSDREWLNFLALNLADEVAGGAKDPAQARAFYDKTVTLAASGKRSGYTESLLFDTTQAPPSLQYKDLRY